MSDQLTLTPDQIAAEVKARSEARVRINAQKISPTPAVDAQGANYPEAGVDAVGGKLTTVQARIKEHGIIHPVWTEQAAAQVGLALEHACASLLMETDGGYPFVGHDPGNPINGYNHKWTTEPVYRLMVHYVGEGYPSQGMGPCQLTSRGLQEEADRLGGTWVIVHNQHIGFLFLRQLIDEFGVEGGFQHFNGSGAAAVRYGEEAVRISDEFAPLCK